MRYLILTITLALSISIFTGCASKKVDTQTTQKISKKIKLEKIDFDDIDGFEQDNLQKAFTVFKKDCKAKQIDPNLKDVCKEASNYKDGRVFFTKNFIPYQIIDQKGDDEGLITGYYEPTLKGNYYKTKKYKYPIYKLPNDLVKIDLADAYPSLANKTLRGKLIKNKVVSYGSRQEIDSIDYRTSKSLKPICFVDDKIDLFFLHIQGSGKILLPNGKYIYVGYAGQNGYPYYSIGKEFIKRGLIKKEDISLETIKQWLKTHPQQADEIMNLNRSYIFFQVRSQGATGSLGTLLIPNRNIAIDKTIVPLGYPVFIQTTNPITQQPINKLVVAADTGGAIKGDIRADIFFGSGKIAQKLAGMMKNDGKLIIFVPKNNSKEKDALNK